ncbi:hypothetical protein LAZ67_22001002 [Cordylochernes scorpioides]|uniref:Reverse transcriptase Ty1/copia-type domain-containing protein n=1 Tax=Cordylochernes scorpioides TaxID=51811 RepID=A0ABY6LNS3_9ARAC|nr:hypothetical protein LAZ67_22001002 [Cordylochernes scorpioides]
MPIKRWPGATTPLVVEDTFVQYFVRPDLALTCLQLALVAWFSLRLYLQVRHSEDTSNRFINKLRHHLEIKDVTCKGMFLGIKIIQDKEGISLQQSHYVQQILQKYGMENCKEVPTPGSKETNLDNHIEDDNCDQHTYQEALGMLMFLAVNTRPDIAYITSKLSRYSRQPKQMHWTAIKRVMRYIRGTIDLGVKFERGKTGILKSYTDASWSTTHDGKSYGGYVFKLGEATIDWKSSKQPLIALSTMEAEMIAACESCCQIKWIINLLRAGRMEFHGKINCDLYRQDICLLYKPSQDLEADIFTKDLSRDQMKKHLENLSIVGIKKNWVLLLQFVGAAQSKKILELAQKQNEELETELGNGEELEDKSLENNQPRLLQEDSDDDDDDLQEEDLEKLEEINNTAAFGDMNLHERTPLYLGQFSLPKLPFLLFSSSPIKEHLSLKDTLALQLGCVMFQKLTEEELEALELFGKPTKEEIYEILDKFCEEDQEAEVSEELLGHYRMLGQVLSHYRSGKSSRALPSLPHLKHWKRFIQVMKPEKWTAAAMRQVTKHHVSALRDLPKSKRLTEFFKYILLPRMRDDILEYKKLNYHLFTSLMKAASLKPWSFYKGIIFALIESGNCMQREARIMCSILRQQTIHLEASSVALIKLAEMPHSAVSTMFMQVLLAKKYRLKEVVVTNVVNHFTRSTGDHSQKYTVLWHYCLLTLCHMYSYAMTPIQRDAIRKLVAVHSHKDITPEILAALNCTTGSEERMEE